MADRRSLRWTAALALLFGCRAEAPARPAPERGAAGFVAGEVLFSVQAGTSRGELEVLLAPHGVTAIEPLAVPGWWRGKVPPSADPWALASELRRSPRIDRAQPNLRYRPHLVPNDPDFDRQWAHQFTEAARGWDLGTGDHRVVVAVIGSGISTDHPELDGNLWRNSGEIAANGLDDDANGFVDDLVGWDFVDQDGDPRPRIDPELLPPERALESHETKVAGVIGAEGNNQVSVAGVSWRVSLMALRFGFTSTGAVAAIQYAADNGAHVINMSFGSAIPGEAGRDPLQEEALDAAAAAGVVLVASAGNDNLELPQYPAALPEVIAVAATALDELGAEVRADFSNYGTWVDVAAPGAGVLTTDVGGGLAPADGTSFSAPYVAGLAALLLAKNPTWDRRQVRDAIVYGGDKINTDRFIGQTRANVAGSMAQQDGAPPAFARFVDPFGAVRVGRGVVLRLEGTAIGERFLLEMAPIGSAQFTPLAAGTSTRGTLVVLETSGFAEGDYQLRLTASRGPAADTDWLSLSVEAGPLPGWPAALGRQLIGAPAAADLDGDRSLEVLAVDGRGELIALHGDGSPLTGWPVPLGGPSRAPPAIGDLEGDGDLEVALATDQLSAGEIWVLHHDATPASGWPRRLGRVRGAVALGDLDCDGRLEVVAVESGAPSGQVWAFTATAAVMRGWPVNLHHAAEASPVVADLDGDGCAEVVVASARLLHVLRGDGTPHPRWPQVQWIRGLGADPAAVDLDGDGQSEVLALEVGQVVAYDLDGRMVRGWPAQTDVLAIGRRLSAGDLDADGRPEVVAGLNNGQIWAWSAAGAPLPGYPARAPEAIQSGAVIGDVDGDGAADAVVVDVASVVHALGARAAPARGFPRRFAESVPRPPLLVDLDRDRQLDVVLAGAGFHAYGLRRPLDPFAVEWPSERRDPYNSGALPPVFSLHVAAIDARTVELRWAPPRGIGRPRRYLIQRDGRQIAETATTSFRDPLTDPRRVVRYRVAMVDETEMIRGRSRLVEVSLQEVVCAGLADGAPCDDGDPCSTGDRCVGGGCAGVGSLPDSSPCDDGNRCTSNDLCLAGVCRGDELDCAQSEGSCQLSRCDPLTGACSDLPRTDGASCEDGEPCTELDFCSRGRCVPRWVREEEAACDDGEPCTREGRCRAGRCEGQFPRPDGASCDEGNRCTTVGVCQQARCIGVEPEPEGAGCDDGDPCTQRDVCRAGVCSGEDPVACPASSGCSGEGRCDRETGSCIPRSLPDMAPCDDGDGCTPWDYCVAGYCVGYAALSCPGDPLGTTSCDPESGRCPPPAPEVAPPGGCGCRSSGASGAGWLLLGGWWWLSRAFGRRRGGGGSR